jgi:hypothetical protein
MLVRTAIVVATSLAMGVTLSLAGTNAAAAPPTPISPAATGPTAPATADQAARQGGRVIVVLKQQYPDLKVKQQGSARTQATLASQSAITSDITSHGGGNVLHLVSVNAVAAQVTPAEVARLLSNPDVASVQHDESVVLPTTTAVPASNVSSKICPTNPSKPLLEPEALTLSHFKSQPAAATDADQIATGKGVRVGLTDINALAGNPNLIRPDGEHVVIDSPTPNADDDDTDGGGDEWYGDASRSRARAR